MLRQMISGLAVLGFVIASAVLVWTHLSTPAYSGAYYTDKVGVAIRGYDPVAYFTESKPVKGKPSYKVKWGGATWQFASKENLDLFNSDPEKYAPQYGGFCAWAVAEKGQAFSVDPKAWRIVDKKLYLNYSQKIQKKWEQDIPGFIQNGDKKWPTLKKKLQTSRGS